MASLYRLEHRVVGYCTFISVVCRRGNIEVRSSEKAIPPIFEYSVDGSFRIVGPREVVSSLKSHPYKPNSPEFSKQRLADLEVSMLYKHLENFPTLSTIYEDGKTKPHPLTEYLYSQMVYLRPDSDLAAKLNKLTYVQKTESLPLILEKLAANVEKKTGIKIDLFSVPKRKVGTFAYIGDVDGIAKVAKTFAFGFHNIIPCDRIARELSSLKSAEKFSNPQEVPYDLPDEIRPYVSMLRVGIVGVKHSMLDGADLYKSGLNKIASRLSRKKITRDITSVPKEKRNIVAKPFRAGIEIYHEDETVVDELESSPGGIRLVFPGGVKVVAGLSNSTARDAKGKSIDALMSFETFAKKGALACFVMSPENALKNLTLDEATELFMAKPKEKIVVDGVEYLGYIVDLPVIRPGQRYTELSKVSNSITTDLIAKAILKAEYKVSDSKEEEYLDLVHFRNALVKEISKLSR